MLNGDISNRQAEILVFIQGKDFVYRERSSSFMLFRLWFKLARKFATTFKRDRLMLNLIVVNEKALRASVSLSRSHQYWFKLMAYDMQEFFILNTIAQYALVEKDVLYVYDEEAHKDYRKIAHLFISNRYVGVEGLTRQLSFSNADVVLNNLNEHVNFGERSKI